MILAIINDAGGSGRTASAPTRWTVRRGICGAFVLALLPVPAHTLPPGHATAWSTRGVADRNVGRYADAVDANQEAVRLDPNYADAWYLLGLAYAGSGDRIAALECVGPLRRLDPARADALFHMVGPR